MFEIFSEINADFFSLQKGELAERELKDLVTNKWRGPNIKEFDTLNDFLDTAALIEHLDIVITVCTSVCHLAGALGKETWLLNPYETCWRWFDDDRKDSPWYPTLKIFRQKKSGDWRGVIDEVSFELKKRV